MKKKKNKNSGVISLIILLFVVLIGGMMFIGATSGWFDDGKVILDAEYYSENHNENAEYLDLTATKYNELIAAKKSFLVFVDQEGCKTADKLGGFILDYMKEKGIKVYRMMFSEVKKSSLSESVKYYPSFVIVERGRVRGFLRADNDEDAGSYNDYNNFKIWIERYL